MPLCFFLVFITCTFLFLAIIFASTGQCTFSDSSMNDSMCYQWRIMEHSLVYFTLLRIHYVVQFMFSILSSAIRFLSRSFGLNCEIHIPTNLQKSLDLQLYLMWCKKGLRGIKWDTVHFKSYHNSWDVIQLMDWWIFFGFMQFCWRNTTIAVLDWRDHIPVFAKSSICNFH